VSCVCLPKKEKRKKKEKKKEKSLEKRNRQSFFLGKSPSFFIGI